MVKAQPNKSMDVRAKQLLSYLACLVSLKLRGGGFATRHLSRWVLRGEVNASYNKQRGKLKNKAITE